MITPHQAILTGEQLTNYVLRKDYTTVRNLLPLFNQTLITLFGMKLGFVKTTSGSISSSSGKMEQSTSLLLNHVAIKKMESTDMI